MIDNYQPIIGLEIHVELKTVSKMFCGCKNDPFHAPKPNIYTCPVCLGLPGALPVPNRKAVEWAIILGLALNCKIPSESKFDRKNYFYPDLPKGYQISQYDQPFACNGKLKFKIKNEKSNIEKEKTIRITRVHLEEDTGKLQHALVFGKKVSLIDFNRSGVPLVEIVTEPDIRSSEEARIFLKKLHQIIRYLGISDADMEKGSMRVEPNISVWQIPNPESQIPNKLQISKANLPKYKVEVKNINSFKFVAKAIEFEIKRQIGILERGEIPKQETRGWDEKKNITVPQRSKEEAHDYRYFPEPDIPPMRWSQKMIDDLRYQIKELPDQKISRYIKDLGLPLQDVERLTENQELAEYFEEVISLQSSDIRLKKIFPKLIVNWLLNKKIDLKKTRPADLLNQIATGQKKVSIDNNLIDNITEEILSNNPQAIVSYKSGKTGVIMFLVGQTMKKLAGKGDPQTIRQILEKKLL